MTRSTLHLLCVGVAVLAIVSAPLFVGRFTVSLLNDIGIAAFVVLGLVLLTGIGGTTSFGQATFVGIAAYASAWLTTSHGFSPWIGLPFSLALTGLSALAIGILTLRLGGHFLPLSTIAWGLSLSTLFGNVGALGGHTGLSNLPPLHLGTLSLATPQSIYILIWVTVGGLVLFSSNLLNSRTGRVIRSLRGGRGLLASVGADADRMRLMLFIVAALFAGISGWFYAHTNRFVSPSPFDIQASIQYLLMALAGGMAQLTGAIVGSAAILSLKNSLQDILPLLAEDGHRLEPIVFAALFIALLHFARVGLTGVVSRWSRRWVRPTPRYDLRLPVTPLAHRSMPKDGEVILSVKGVSKRFGGLIAVNDVSFDVRAGEIVGLIGPNGAGKSTMFNLLTRATPISAGEVRFLDRDLTGLRQHRVAQLGIARTFQHVKLRPQMSLLDNVALGAHSRTSAGFLRAGLRLDRAEERQILHEAFCQLTRVGLQDRLHERAESLPLGLQRILEIARALASDPILLVLDEPAAGLRHQEKLRLAEMLSQLRREGVSILIVEHDMSFVMGLVDRLVVMNFGSKLIEGTPAEVQADQGVQEAYLGT